MLQLDYTYMTAAAIQAGLSDVELREGWKGLALARHRLEADWRHGKLGFLELPDREDLVQATLAEADRARSRRCTHAVVLGIGGSALGTIVLRDALAGELTLPVLHVVDNIDPNPLGALLRRLPLESTCFVVVSKSGETVETLAQYLVAREQLERARLDPREHFVFVTDPHRGALRRMAEREGITALPVPANVGGRFSVLSPVGLFPAALCGIDVPSLLAGARAVRDATLLAAPERDPAGAFAMLQWLAHTRKGRGIHVLMPYWSSLRTLGDWFVQLWAESLGKQDDYGNPVGPTPVAALGATDQHSQLQLFVDGPPDKTITFVRVVRPDGDVAIPDPDPAQGETSLLGLGGRGLADLLDAEYRATAASLAARNRPSMTISLERVDPWHLGGLLMFFQIATAYAGTLYGVNAFDQPGVELGKRLTNYLLGRPGFQDVGGEWEAVPPADPACIVSIG
jgi:glucose-6-phosphate isomerase